MLVFLLATAAAQEETPIGRYLAYQRRALDDISKTCAYQRFLLKHDQNCAGVTDRPAPYAPLATARRRLQQNSTTRRLQMQQKCIRPLFVTGCGGSGTHFVASFLAATRKVGKVAHEDPSPTSKVLVSWAARYGPALLDRQNMYGKWGVPKQQLRPPMVAWARHQGRAPCTYRVVAHVVRHPLKVLSSSVAFGQCVECWLHVDEFTVPPMAQAAHNRTFLDLTKATRLAILGNRATHRARPQGGRAWPQHSIDAILKGFGLYWLAWNAMIERVADFRFQIEKADYEKLCVAAGASIEQCRAGVAAARRAAATFEKGKHGGDTMRVTWERLDELDSDLSARVWALARRYGYDREPPARPS